MTSTFDAFAGIHFDPVFSDTAVAPWAENAARLNLESFHRDARQAVGQVVDGACDNLDPSMRVALIQGEAGFGKTHAVIVKLWQLSQEERVYPVVMQLSANVSPEEVSLWMLRSVVDQLDAHHFRDKQDRTPMRRLADSLWTFASTTYRNAYDKAIANDNDDEKAKFAIKAARQIRQVLQTKGIRAIHDPIIAGLLLAADDASFAFSNWLHGGTNSETMGSFVLSPLVREDDRRDALVSIAKLASATGSPLIFVLDQIEAISRIGSQELLAKVITSAVQLVEAGVPGTGVVISALSDTFEQLKVGHLTAGFVSRIEHGVAPIKLTPSNSEDIQRIIDLRAKFLLERAGADLGAADVQSIAPNWLLKRATSTMLRDAIQLIRDYRTACRGAGRFLTASEYSAQDLAPPVSPADNFDKLWQDEIDADTGSIANINAHERVELFSWLAQHAALELPQIESSRVNDFTLEGAEPTRVVDLCFVGRPGGAVERWKIAFADAPNAQNRLHNQIESFLNDAHDAKPALLRVGPLTRVTDDGKPVQSIAHVRGSQAGPQLANLLEAGGRLAPTKKKDWSRLRLAKKFVSERCQANGFTLWRAERRFLLDMAEIGVMTSLVQPEGDGGRNIADAAIISNGSISDHITNGQVRESSSGDPRDHANVRIGRALEGQSEVCWTLDQKVDPKLPNFGLLVSGDAGQGKTQVIKALIAEAAALGCPILIFDFKNDYGGTFASTHGFELVDLNERLPFNPLKLPPHGPSGAQAINHIFEVAGLLGDTLHLGDQQKALLRNALEAAYAACGVPLNDWVDPDKTPAPSLGNVVEKAAALDQQSAVKLINRLGLLHGKRLLPADGEARMSFASLVEGKIVLSFGNLPNDDQLKRALAELVLIQLQGHMLRGEQPRALRRLLIFDEAWRAADSKRLIQLAREGRAFGVGIVAGSQFADDLSAELTGNLATKIHFYNSDAAQRRKIVQTILGTTTGTNAALLRKILSSLKQFQAVFTNQRYLPYVSVKVEPYFERS